ncbi:zinc finger protein with KRAB and SCAN domains 5 [Trichonephila clavipes]|nr:zinc finger protein with KRAB and SCAN domains 5 [Trichonephila clavipes]
MKCFECDQCEMVYASNSALSRHKKWHKGGNPLHRFRCELCLYSTDSRKDFKRHGFIHSGERPFTCTLCGRGFTRNNHLKRHMLTHSNYSPFSCNMCLKKFRRSDHLAIHVQKHQEESLAIHVQKQEESDFSIFAIPTTTPHLDSTFPELKSET